MLLSPTAAARLGASCGALFVVAINVGNGLAFAGQGGVDALADLRQPTTAITALGLALELLGFVAFAFFAGWLVGHLRRHEPDGWFAAVAGIAATTTLAIKLGGSLVPIVAAEQHAGVLSADLARTLVDLGGAGFVVSALPFAVFVLAAAASMLRGATIPGWLGWSGIVIGAVGLVTPTMGVIDPANYNALPFMVGLLWTLVASVLLAIRAVSAVDVPPAVTSSPVARTAGA